MNCLLSIFIIGKNLECLWCLVLDSYKFQSRLPSYHG
uniref:Uncharacterized protein n=1 Tax=Rhizophora mucronata TaxID=61149 RepID=A0A2P2R4Z7_RHIMU